jgi:hypothetical protein
VNLPEERPLTAVEEGRLAMVLHYRHLIAVVLTNLEKKSSSGLSALT